MSLPLALAAAILLAFSTVPHDASAKPLAGAARSALIRKATKVDVIRVEAHIVGEKPRDVVISRAKYPQAAAHIEHAQRNGQPTVLHIHRKGAAQNRRAAAGAVRLNPKPAPRYERDEYPPAFTREGGRNANVRFISPHDNRGAGAAMRAQTRDLRDNAKIRVVLDK